MKTFISNISGNISKSGALSLFITTFFVTMWLASCDSNDCPAPQMASLSAAKSIPLIKERNSPMCKVNLNIMYVKGTEGNKANEINKTIEYRLFGISGVGIKHAADSFMEKYTSDYIENFAPLYKADMGDESKTSWYDFYYNVHTSVVDGRPGIMVYRIDIEYYEGGAHAIKQTFYINFDIETGKQIAISDIFVPGHTRQLNLLLLEALKEKTETEDINGLHSKGYLCSTEIFAPENFIIGNKGITFIYNTYEIAPYDRGMTELYIEYSDIGKLMKDNKKD